MGFDAGMRYGCTVFVGLVIALMSCLVLLAGAAETLFFANNSLEQNVDLYPLNHSKPDITQLFINVTNGFIEASLDPGEKTMLQAVCTASAIGLMMVLIMIMTGRTQERSVAANRYPSSPFSFLDCLNCMFFSDRQSAQPGHASHELQGPHTTTIGVEAHDSDPDLESRITEGGAIKQHSDVIAGGAGEGREEPEDARKLQCGMV
jgi:hypothetical protein